MTSPDWRARFAELAQGWPRLERYLAEDEAYEQLLKQWRRHNATFEDGKRIAASAIDGMIALSCLQIFPPRSLIRDVPRDGKLFVEQHDAHMWLRIQARAWRIEAIEDALLYLDSFGEKMTIDLGRARWEKYCDAAVNYILAARPS